MSSRQRLLLATGLAIAILTLSLAILGPILFTLFAQKFTALPARLHISIAVGSAVLIPALCAGARIAGLSARRVSIGLAALALIFISIRSDLERETEEGRQRKKYQLDLNEWKREEQRWRESDPNYRACQEISKKIIVGAIRQRTDAGLRFKSLRCAHIQEEYNARNPPPKKPQVVSLKVDPTSRIVEAGRWFFSGLLGPAGLEAILSEFIAYSGYIWGGFIIVSVRRSEEIEKLRDQINRLEKQLEAEQEKNVLEPVEVIESEEELTPVLKLIRNKTHERLEGYNPIKVRGLTKKTNNARERKILEEVLAGLNEEKGEWYGYTVSGVRKKRVGTVDINLPVINPPTGRVQVCGTDAALRTVNKTRDLESEKINPPSS